MDDNILRMYIDEVFGYYDQDRSGTLDKRELVNFFNQLFQSFHDPRRVDQNTINQMLTACDMNRDGQISKPELFTLFKRVLTGDTTVYPQAPQYQNYGPQNYGGNQYPYQGGNQYPNQYQNQGNQFGNQFNQPYNGPQQGYQGYNNPYLGPKYY